MDRQQLPPAPNGHLLLGNLREFRRDTLGFLLENRRYGDVTLFRFGPFPAYIVNHPDDIHRILVTDADDYFKSRATKEILNPIIGNGLFTNDGDSWKRQRRLVQPAFHTNRIASYARIMVVYTLDMLDSWQQGETYDVDREMTSLTMKIIAKSLFDAELSGAAGEIGSVITTALSILNDRFNRIMPLPLWIPTPENRRLNRAIRRLDELIQQFIDDRRRSGEDKGDLLSMLLIARDEDGSGQMTDQQVRDEAMTLFGAGHETTAAALTWTWYLLSQHPDVEARLHEELDAVLAGRLPTLDDLPALRYTEMVIKEAMRLYPPAWSVTREATADIEIGGYTLKKGSTILINVYGVHRDPRFFPDPDRFDPERFGPENEKRIPKYAYLPFGGGPRVCIGNAFATMEARLILATVAQRYRLSLAPGHQVMPQRVFTLRPQYGLRMVTALREPVAAPTLA